MPDPAASSFYQSTLIAERQQQKLSTLASMWSSEADIPKKLAPIDWDWPLQLIHQDAL